MNAIPNLLEYIKIANRPAINIYIAYIMHVFIMKEINKKFRVIITEGLTKVVGKQFSFVIMQ